MKPIHLRIQLDNLICHKRSGTGDPYIWTIFFKADNECLKITDEFALEGKPIFKVATDGYGGLGRNFRALFRLLQII